MLHVLIISVLSVWPVGRGLRSCGPHLGPSGGVLLSRSRTRSLDQFPTPTAAPARRRQLGCITEPRRPVPRSCLLRVLAAGMRPHQTLDSLRVRHQCIHQSKGIVRGLVNVPIPRRKRYLRRLLLRRGLCRGSHGEEVPVAASSDSLASQAGIRSDWRARTPATSGARIAHWRQLALASFAMVALPSPKANCVRGLPAKAADSDQPSSPSACHCPCPCPR